MELLDRYQPLFVIGRGGMGTIEAAVERGERSQSGEHASGARVVALKRMLPEARDRRHVDMFLREARLATLLNHDNVVHAFAFGEQQGELFIAMEYVEGETLASLQSALGLLGDGQRIPIDVTLYVLAALCDGLHAAHELRDVGGARLGVVHRDVSPHNVILSYRGDVKLLDFGVAKLDNAAHLTKTGEVKGKTAYMSPEQAMGDALDRRSDLYSVGAVLFEMVAGRRMWTGETDLELVRQLALADPPRLADVAKDAPRELDALHARLVAKKVKDRFETAQDVAKALRELAAKLPPADAPPRTMLARLLHEHFAEQERAKRAELESALAPAGARPLRGHPSNHPSRIAADGDPRAVIAPATQPRTSRVAPWMYALVGAAIASAAVLGLARNRVPSPVTATTVVTTTATGTVTTPSSATTSRIELAAPEASGAGRSSRPQSTNSRVRPAPARSAAPTASTTAAPARPPIDVDTHAI